MGSKEPQRMTRISVAIPAEYQYRNNKGECVIIDFSEGGITIEANQILLEGDLLRVKASPVRNMSLDIWCVVRSVQGRKIGLQFEEISNTMRKQLQDYVYSLLETNQKSKYENY